MKKIILVLLLIVNCQLLIGQVDPPSGYTDNYRLRKYNEGDHPSADSVNANLNQIDLEIRNRQKSIDSLKLAFKVNNNFPNGTFKSNVVPASVTTSTFFYQYFVRDYSEGTDQWRLKVDLTQIDNDTIKIRSGVFGKIDSANQWNGINTFHNEVTRFGDGTSATINYLIANDLGAITWQKNGTTIAKWDEGDGTYWQFLYSVDVTGDVSISGYFKPASHSDSGAPNGSIYYSTTQSKLVYKDNSGSVQTLY